MMQVTGTFLLGLPLIILAKYHGAGAATPFGIFLQIIMAIQIPVTVMLQPIWVKMKQLIIIGEYKDAKKIFLQYMGISLIYAPIIMMLFIFIVPSLISYFLEDKVNMNLDQSISYGLWAIFGLIGGGGVGMAMMALGLTRQLAVIGFIQLAIFSVVGFIYISKFSDVGAVYSIIATYLFSIPISIILIINKLNKLNKYEYI
jgi:hypothetical protein